MPVPSQQQLQVPTVVIPLQPDPTIAVQMPVGTPSPRFGLILGLGALHYVLAVVALQQVFLQVVAVERADPCLSIVRTLAVLHYQFQ